MGPLLALAIGLAAADPVLVEATTSAVPELPAAEGVAAVALPPVTVRSLPGGAQLWEAPVASSPLVAVELVWTLPPDLMDPAMARALRLLPGMIDAGALGAPDGGLDAQLEPMGATVRVGAERTGLRLRLLVPPEGLGPALATVGEALAAPACDQRELSRWIERTDAALARAGASSNGELGRVEARGLYPPGHPLAPWEGSVALERGALLEQHARLRSRGGAVVVLAGPVGAAERDLVAEALSFLGPPPAAAELSSARVEPGRSSWLIERPGARQVRISVSWPVPPELSWAEAQLTADLLGGGATARLDRRLREELGLVYEARARILRRPGHAVLRVTTRVDEARAVEAVTALGAELEAMVGVSAAELQRARATRLFAVARSLDGAEGTAAALAELAALGLTPAERQEELDALASTPFETVRADAARLLDPATAAWVILGSGEALFELEPHLPRP